METMVVQNTTVLPTAALSPSFPQGPSTSPNGQSSIDAFYHAYEILEDLGSGQFAVVRKAVHRATGVPYAAKFIKKRRFNASRRGVKRSDIDREISILESVGDHENIVQLCGVYESATEVILLLELVSGGELFDHVCARESLTEDEASAFVRQILLAVEHLHEHHIVHLDLKPENVLLKEKNSSQVKLIDFGLSRRIAPKDQVRDMIGTPEFVAPEVVNYEPLSSATDMWALGVVTYILLSGVSPFLGHDRDGTFANISTVTYDFEERFFRDTTDMAKDFIRRLFLRNPAARMTAKQCLEHPWIRPPVADSPTGAQVAALRKEHEINVSHLRSFSIRKRWRSAVYAIILCNRLVKRHRQKMQSVSSPSTPHDNRALITNGSVEHEQLGLAATKSFNSCRLSPVPPPSAREDLAIDPAELTRTALFCAAQERNLSGLEELLSRIKVDVNSRNNSGETPLHMACAAGYGDVAALLLSHRCDATIRAGECEQTALHYAAARGSLECVRAILNAQATCPVDKDAIDSTGATPLHLATAGGHLDTALYLLQTGVALDVQDHSGETPLHIAVREGYLTLVQALCSLGCDLNIQNKDSHAPLIIATREGHLEVVRTLCLANADIRVTDSNGLTPDEVANQIGFLKIAELIGKLKNEPQRGIYMDQLRPGSQPLKRVKLKFFGHSGTGKSQLISSLKAGGGIISNFFRQRSDGSMGKDEIPLHIPNGRPSAQKNKIPPPDNPGYTRGIDVGTFSIGGVGDFSIWEFPGYAPYHVVFDHFVGNTDCIHVLTFKLADPQEVQYTQVLYWLNFLKARMLPGEIGYAGRNPRPARVILVGTHADLANLQRCSDGEYVSSEADAMRQTLQVRFAGDFLFYDTMILVDSRQHNSTGLKGIKALLSKMKPEITANLIRHTGFVDAALGYLSQLRKSQAAFPVLTWPSFVEMMRVHVNPLAGEIHCRQLMQQLQLMGEVIYLKGDQQDFDYVVYHSAWLCKDILGAILSHEFLESCRVTGSYTPDDLQLLLFSDIPDMLDLMQLLDALELCAHEEDNEEPVMPEYEFPSFIFVDPPSSLWSNQDLPDFAYGGLRLQAPHGQEHQLGCMFSRLQVQLRRSLAEFADPMECDLAQWRGCSTLCSGNMEAMIRLYRKDQAIEIQVRGPAENRTSCFYFLEDLINIAEQTIASIAPGLPLERHFMSPRDIMQHSPTPIVYPPDSVIKMQVLHKTTLKSPALEEAHPGESFVEVVCFGRKDVALNLTLGIDLPVAQLPLHARRELAALLDPQDPMGRDWSILGATLGLQDALKDVDATGPRLSKTDQILVEWSLCAHPSVATIGTLFDKLNIMGREDAMEVLYRAVPLYLVSTPADDGEDVIDGIDFKNNNYSSCDMFFEE